MVFLVELIMSAMKNKHSLIKIKKGLLLALFFAMCISLLFFVPQLPHSTENSEIREVSILNVDSDVAFCKGALINGNLITASHCLGSRRYIKIKDGLKFKVVNTKMFDLVSNYSKTDIESDDLAIQSLSGLKGAKCMGVAFTLQGKSCSVMKMKTGSYYSSNCHFPKGDSGTVLVNKKKSPCLVYSGYYDIISKNNNNKIKIGVFKTLENYDE